MKVSHILGLTLTVSLLSFGGWVGCSDGSNANNPDGLDAASFPKPPADTGTPTADTGTGGDAATGDDAATTPDTGSTPDAGTDAAAISDASSGG